MLTVQRETLKETQTQRKSEPCSSSLLYLSDIRIQLPDEGKKKLGQAFFDRETDRQNKRVCAIMGMSVRLEVEGLTLFSLL